MMEKFEITMNVEGLPDQLQVIAERGADDDVKYKVFNEQDYLGTVWPECMEEGMCWFSSDEIPEDTVIKIGVAIERAHR